MNWADELIANQLGFPHAVIFPRARDAIKAWTEITGKVLHLPTNVCPVARDWAKQYELHAIDDTGMAPGITTQLYGYREEGDGNSEMDLDPLGTGFFARPCATSAIVSFGEKKFITAGGAAFATRDQGLAQEMESRGYCPPALIDYLKLHLTSPVLAHLRSQKRDKVALWDRHLGDMLQRIDREQIVPWRVMRLVRKWEDRSWVVIGLREAGFDVGTNYPSLANHGLTTSDFGDCILNFFVTDDYDETRIKLACGVIRGVLDDLHHR